MSMQCHCPQWKWYQSVSVSVSVECRVELLYVRLWEITVSSMSMQCPQWNWHQLSAEWSCCSWDCERWALQTSDRLDIIDCNCCRPAVNNGLTHTHSHTHTHTHSHTHVTTTTTTTTTTTATTRNCCKPAINWYLISHPRAEPSP